MEMIKNKKFIKYAYILGAFIAMYFIMDMKTPNVIVEKVTDNLSVSTINKTIEVSEADSNKTRIEAYAHNVSIKFNNKAIKVNGGIVVNNSYYFNGFVLTFTEKDNNINVKVQYGKLNGQTNFNINKHQLIKGKNAVYGTKSYGYMFDTNGNKINDGHIDYHEQDLDENGNVIGIQDETKVVMSTTQKVDSKPIITTSGKIEEVKLEQKQEYKNELPPVKNDAAGADMDNVEETVEEIPTAPISDYKQIVIANANGNDDGTTLNYVSTNGGEGILVLLVTSVNGNTYNCINENGAIMTITITTNSNGTVSISGINGLFA